MNRDRKKNDAEFIRQYTLSQQQLKKLIAEKLERAVLYSKAIKQREALCR